MTRPRKIDATGTDTRERVLVAAMRLIAERGYASTRLAAVAADAGVSIGLVQHYFHTRAGLLQAAFNAGTEAGLARARTIVAEAGTAHDRLLQLLVYICSDGVDPLEGSWGFWLELSLAARREPELALPVETSSAAWEATLAGVIEEGIEDGTIPTERPPARLASDLLALLYGIKMVGGPGLDDPATAARRAMGALDLTPGHREAGHEAGPASHRCADHVHRLGFDHALR